MNEVNTHVKYAWTSSHFEELYKCYHFAKCQKLKVKEGTYNIWKMRNHHIKEEISIDELNKKDLIL